MRHPPSFHIYAVLIGKNRVISSLRKNVVSGYPMALTTLTLIFEHTSCGAATLSRPPAPNHSHQYVSRYHNTLRVDFKLHLGDMSSLRHSWGPKARAGEGGVHPAGVKQVFLELTYRLGSAAVSTCARPCWKWLLLGNRSLLFYVCLGVYLFVHLHLTS